MYAQMALKTYRTAGVASEVEAASPFRLVQILMQEAAQELNLALARGKAGQVQQRRRSVSRAIELIDELRLGLKPQSGSEVADRLIDLYSYMIRELLKTNLSDDSQTIGSVAGLMETIRSAWNELPGLIDKQPQKDQKLEGYINVI